MIVGSSLLKNWYSIATKYFVRKWKNISKLGTVLKGLKNTEVKELMDAGKNGINIGKYSTEKNKDDSPYYH